MPPSEEYVTVLDPARRNLISSTSPLLFNLTTNEPYLPVPPNPRRESEFILTPSRRSDVAARVVTLNSPSVAGTLFSPPNPFLAEHAEAFMERTSKASRETLEKWTAGEPPLTCPVGVIRERRSDGIETFAGDIGLHRESKFLEVADEKERERLCTMNAGRKAGDPEIIWSVGFFLVEEYSGKGLMTDCLNFLIDGYFPVLNGTIIESTAFVGNEASRAVHLKAGFVQTGITSLRMREDRGGQMRDLWTLVWKKQVPT